MTARPCSTYIANVAPGRRSKLPQKLSDWLDSKGKVVRQREHSSRNRISIGPPKFIPWRAALSLPAPLAMAAEATLLEPWIALWSGKETTWPRPWPTRGRCTVLAGSCRHLCAGRPVGVALLPSPTQVWAPVQPRLAGMCAVVRPARLCRLPDPSPFAGAAGVPHCGRLARAIGRSVRVAASSSPRRRRRGSKSSHEARLGTGPFFGHSMYLRTTLAENMDLSPSAGQSVQP